MRKPQLLFSNWENQWKALPFMKDIKFIITDQKHTNFKKPGSLEFNMRFNGFNI